MFILICLVKLLLWKHVIVQTSHNYEFSEVWIWMQLLHCTLRTFLQAYCIIWYGFTPVWILYSYLYNSLEWFFYKTSSGILYRNTAFCQCKFIYDPSECLYMEKCLQEYITGIWLFTCMNSYMILYAAIFRKISQEYIN